MKRISLILSRKSIKHCKLSFGLDIIYDKPFNNSLKEKLEKVLYSAALIITGTIKGISLQIHHVNSMLKRSENDHLHVVSTWNPRGVFAGFSGTFA